MTTITGTPVSSPNSITLLDLTTRIRAALSGQNYGTDRWNKTQVQSWIKQAIRDYSIRFPDVATTTITTTPGTYAYPLPALFMAILSVRDHTTTPPTYYHARPHNTPSFWQETAVYALIPGSHATRAQLWLPNTPATTLTIEYHSQHNANLTDADVVTVDPLHHDLLELYCIWQAWIARRETAVTQLEKQDIDEKDYDRIRSAVYATRLDYFTAVSQALRFQEGQSAVIVWQTEEMEQIY